MAEEKRFAIVKFTEEDDAPGIIPLSWLTNDYSMCHYPEAKTDQMRERLIKNAVNPQDKMYKWQLFNVQVMHFYSSYPLARKHLKKAEETSDLDTEHDLSEERPRRKIKKKNFLLPGEVADDLVEKEIQNCATRRPSLQQQHRSIVVPPLPDPGSFHAPVGRSSFFHHSPFRSSDIFSNVPHDYSLNNYPQSPQPVLATDFDNYDAPIRHTLTDISNSCSTSSQNDSSGSKSLYSSETSSPSIYTQSPPITIPLKHAPPRRTTLNPLFQEDLQQNSHYSAKEDRKWVTVLQWMADISEKLERIELKLENVTQTDIPVAEEDDMSIFSLLPLNSLKDFEKLDDALKTNKSLKRKLIKVLRSVGGKNAHALLSNMMRRLMEDNVAEVYNISGTSTKHAHRRAFYGTQLCDVVLDACRTFHKDATDHDMKKYVGDWLNQAHTRIVRTHRPDPNQLP